MLSISKVASGGDYFQYLTRNYYFDQAQHSQWMGQGAHALGLEGEVTAEQFLKLSTGHALDGRALVQNAGDSGRPPGWDLTFSAPKDVSALWAVADDDVKRIIEGCHREAVAAALSYLEESAGMSRQMFEGEDGQKVVLPVRAKLAVATFEDFVSREGDPALHTHSFVENIAVCEDGQTRAVHSPMLYRHKMAGGAIFQATLANLMVSRLGLELTPEEHGFGIKGFVKELSKEWSKRSEQIKEASAAYGSQTAQAKAVAALETRKGKESAPDPGIFDRWRKEAASHGFGPEQVRALLGRARQAPELERQEELERAARQVTEKLLKSESHFSERELVRGVADQCRDGRAHADQIRRAVSGLLKSPDVLAIGQRKDEVRYTTKAVIEHERKFLETARELAARNSHEVSEPYRQKVIRKQFPLRRVSEDDRERNRGQREAVERLTQGDGLVVLSGVAGAGKSTVLDAARKIWEHEGYRVTGMALAGKAAGQLQKSSGIESTTLDRRLTQLEDKGFAGTVWHHLKQMAKTAANEIHGDVNLPVYKNRPFTLDKNTVVVLDEAGMVGTEKMARLLAHVHAAGAKLVLVGAGDQLQPMHAGGPFRRLEGELEALRLTHITRQRVDPNDPSPYWRRDAVTLFMNGHAKEGLALYSERGLVSVEDDRKKAAQKLVSDWAENGGPKDPKNHLIIAGTNADVRYLNALCQEERLKGVDVVTRLRSIEHNGERFHAGDRVLFTAQDGKLGFTNGTLGTVRDIGGVVSRRLSVQVDDGATVTVPLAAYGHVRLGYAATTHKAQGSTVDYAYILLGGPMQDLHLSYVQASRARFDPRFYADRIEAGPEMERLAKAMSVARPKEMAHDLFAPVQPRAPQHEMERGR